MRFLPSRLAPDAQLWRSSASRSGFSGVDSSITSRLIRYFSLDQLLKSISRQRSLQKGNSGEVSEFVAFRQIGHCRFIPTEYRKVMRSQVLPELTLSPDSTANTLSLTD